MSVGIIEKNMDNLTLTRLRKCDNNLKERRNESNKQLAYFLKVIYNYCGQVDDWTVTVTVTITITVTITLKKKKGNFRLKFVFEYYLEMDEDVCLTGNIIFLQIK